MTSTKQRRTVPKKVDDEFWRVLKEYRRIMIWALGSSLIPILLGLASLAPPWPPSIIQITSLIQLIAVILIFHFLNTSGRIVVDRILIVSAVALAVISVVYLIGISIFVYTEPVSKQRFVRGFVCTKNAILLYAEYCPWLEDKMIAKGEWEAQNFWTLGSITAARLGLSLSWLAAFGSLASFIASFVTYRVRGTVQGQ